MEDAEMKEEEAQSQVREEDDGRKMTEENNGLNLDSLRDDRLMSGGVTSSYDE